MILSQLPNKMVVEHQDINSNLISDMSKVNLSKAPLADQKDRAGSWTSTEDLAGVIMNTCLQSANTMARDMLSSWSAAIWQSAVGRCSGFYMSAISMPQRLIRYLAISNSKRVDVSVSPLAHPTSASVAYPLVQRLLSLLTKDPIYSLLCAHLLTLSPDCPAEGVKRVIHCLSCIYGNNPRASKQGSLLIQIALWRYFFVQAVKPTC